MAPLSATMLSSPATIDRPTPTAILRASNLRSSNIRLSSRGALRSATTARSSAASASQRKNSSVRLCGAGVKSRRAERVREGGGGGGSGGTSCLTAPCGNTARLPPRSGEGKRLQSGIIFNQLLPATTPVPLLRQRGHAAPAKASGATQRPRERNEGGRRFSAGKVHLQ